MTIANWQLQYPVSAIVFDCDGTLSSIEGINELARYNGVGAEITALTEKAMSETGINPSLYQTRLNLVKPYREQLYQLAQAYYLHCVPDVQAVIALLTRLGKSIYIVSAGLNPAVTLFGELLKISAKHIYAVNLTFDQQGNYVDYERHSPLTTHLGKRTIINQLKIQHENIIHVGDGLNDYVTQDVVSRFIGYGGIYYREKLAALCEYYIKTASLASLLPLVLTQNEYEKLTTEEQRLYKKGLQH
ncbi:MAG: HAD-IB family phosphatase [Gammaproteobacteria bacterium]|nr:HAD-IB family phosphatase [Gammaproteobacteria bacterium]